MRSFERCVGIAAPQIGELTRIAVVDVRGHPKAETDNGLLVLANPRVVEAEGSEVAREGCLSLPDLTANVRRATRIVVEHAGGRRRVRGLRGALRPARDRPPRRDPVPRPGRVARRRHLPAQELRLSDAGGRAGALVRTPPALPRNCHQSRTTLWIAAEAGIATSAPRMPSSEAPTRTPIRMTSGCTWTARP